MSFGEEAAEDEEENKEISLSLSGKSKSTHDVLNDPKLSSMPVLEVSDTNSIKELNKNIGISINADEVREKLKRHRSQSPNKQKDKLEKHANYEQVEEEYDFKKEEIDRKKKRL